MKRGAGRPRQGIPISTLAHDLVPDLGEHVPGEKSKRLASFFLQQLLIVLSASFKVFLPNLGWRSCARSFVASQLDSGTSSGLAGELRVARASARAEAHSPCSTQQEDKGGGKGILPLGEDFGCPAMRCVLAIKASEGRGRRLFAVISRLPTAAARDQTEALDRGPCCWPAARPPSHARHCHHFHDHEHLTCRTSGSTAGGGMNKTTTKSWIPDCAESTKGWAMGGCANPMLPASPGRRGDESPRESLVSTEEPLSHIDKVQATTVGSR